MKSHESHKIPESRTENVAVADPSITAQVFIIEGV